MKGVGFAGVGDFGFEDLEGTGELKLKDVALWRRLDGFEGVGFLGFLRIVVDSA